MPIAIIVVIVIIIVMVTFLALFFLVVFVVVVATLEAGIIVCTFIGTVARTLVATLVSGGRQRDKDEGQAEQYCSQYFHVVAPGYAGMDIVVAGGRIAAHSVPY
jgi:uncharacterized membrane protein YqiK